MKIVSTRNPTRSIGCGATSISLSYLTCWWITIKVPISLFTFQSYVSTCPKITIHSDYPSAIKLFSILVCSPLSLVIIRCLIVFILKYFVSIFLILLTDASHPISAVPSIAKTGIAANSVDASCVDVTVIIPILAFISWRKRKKSCCQL